MSAKIWLTLHEDQQTTIPNAQLRKRDEWIGRTLAGKYEVQELLGKGGMSAVYKVKHVILGKVYAVKMMHQHMIANSTALERFKQEAAAAAKLTHPNIITVHDYADEEGHPFQTIDYLEGVSLMDEIRRAGHLEPERAMEIFIQASSALAHAHDMNVIHRDLKPSNIMLIEKDGVKDVVKLVDFGIAKVLPQEGEAVQQLTQTGEVFGTPVYMSPEQCLGQKMDARSDIYSFGCLMYETLTGHPPLVGSTVFATIQKHIDETPKSLREDLGASSRLLDALDAIVAKSLAKLPAQRQQTMKELLDELLQAKRGAQAGVVEKVARSLQLLAIRLEPVRKRAPMHLLVSLAVTMVLLVVAVGTIWQWQSQTIKPYKELPWPLFTPEAMVWGTYGQNNEAIALATMTFPQLKKRAEASLNSEDLPMAAKYEMSLIAPFAKNGNYAQAASEAVVLQQRFEDLKKRNAAFDPYELLPQGSSRPDAAQELMFIGDACYMSRNWQLAAYYFNYAAEQLAGEAQHANRRLHMKLGDCAYQQHDYDNANDRFHRSAGEWQKEYDPALFKVKDDAFSEDRASWLSRVGDVLAGSRDWAGASMAYLAAAQEWAKSETPRGLDGQAYYQLARCQEQRGLWRDAESNLNKASTAFAASGSVAAKQNVAATILELAKVYRREGAWVQALAAEKQAVDAAHAD